MTHNRSIRRFLDEPHLFGKLVEKCHGIFLAHVAKAARFCKNAPNNVGRHASKRQARVRELYDMARDSQNDLNLASQPGNAVLCESLSKRLRERFPVQEFQPPPAGKKR